MSANRTPKYYALYLTEDNDFRITAHYTRKEAEDYLLARARYTYNLSEDTTFHQLEEIVSSICRAGNITAFIKIGEFANVYKSQYCSLYVPK